MGSSTGIKGVYRNGSGYVAQWVDADGIPQQRRFADKWAAAQWREAVIEGRVPTVRTTLFDQFSANRIAHACTERGLTGRRAAALQGGARWLRSQCRDLLEVDPADAAAVRQALDAVLNRRKHAAPDPRKVAQHWRLVGRWELRDGDLWRDGEPVTIRATSPRPIRLAVEPALAVVPVTRLRAGILQGVLDRVARQHPDPVPAAAFATQLRSVSLLESLGLVERAPATSPMRTAILRLLERAAYLLRRVELDQQMARITENLDRKNSAKLAAAVSALQPLCATYLTLIEPPQATQWALDLAWRVGATEYDAELPPLSEQVNERTLRNEIVRRLPKAADYDPAPLDLSDALRTVGAADHSDTAARYLARVRVSEDALPVRERLRQQVAKFTA